ncbi:outer membrane beta-barrel protein [Hyphococcus sp.]|uniref:outer membrane beta-barrel protein n=1 Tax=Hyphococcus sp. TaxID=2038636 RepID=UPI0035C71175
MRAIKSSQQFDKRGGVLDIWRYGAGAALVFFLCSPTAGAQEETKDIKPYAAVRMTLENADANEFVFDNGYGGVVAAGVRYKEKWRAEISVSRRGSDVIGIPPIEAEGYFRAWAWLLNVYYHPFGVDRVISPYAALGGGFNHASVEALATDPQYEGLGFPEQRYFEKSWQGKLGVALKLREGVYLDAAAAYFVSDDHYVDAIYPHLDEVESAYRTYSALFGLRIEM